ncbi:DsbA family oxidoreductase [Pelagibius litoralis]|uniref:DsbA family oxidoreductase n=1 Tax=Pelagibius litoralis TaxID=374515 RepID=A0A967EUS5_9PROT|nr:DsbA family oxidoreductase [Pelagibius litoralis]NIA67626.1 DsbA family oxidoreductase [Pelagibius litoralis]
MVQIDIFSDTICPWCLIGKRRLEAALALRPDLEVQIRWRTFQLNPQMPREGMERQAYLNLKFGGIENATMIYDRIRAAGAEDGIDFAFEAIQRTPNTLQSHRLIRWSADKHRETELVEALFQAYFTRGEDIGADSVLLDAAEAAGLDRAEAEDFLKSDALLTEVSEEDRQARTLGIDGVPCFIFNGRHALAGAQPPKALAEMLDIARQEEAPATA